MTSSIDPPINLFYNSFRSFFFALGSYFCFSLREKVKKKFLSGSAIWLISDNKATLKLLGRTNSKHSGSAGQQHLNERGVPKEGMKNSLFSSFYWVHR